MPLDAELRHAPALDHEDANMFQGMSFFEKKVR
jgi:hypothetical protein